jgi:hypothetical protein
MTAWSPVWQVSIGNSVYTQVTLANLSMSSGRTDIYSQPVAGYATVELVNTEGADFSIDVNDSFTLQVKDSTGAYTSIFGGYVTDINQSVKSAGSVGIVQTFKITALGALSKLPKTLTNGVLSKDFDGNQIYTILEPVFRNSWNEVAPTLIWSNYTPATETWADAQNVGLGEIDQPGDYELTARSSDETDVYSLISALALSGLGYIYEDSAGRICYADASHRSQYLAVNGYTELSASHAMAKGISTSRRIGDIRNKVSITHKAGAISTAQDDTSIAVYGQQAQNILTSIENNADAVTQAAFYLALRANPQSLFKSITFELTNPEIDDADRDALLGVFMGLPLYIVDLPLNLVGGSFEGFVEGWSFNAGFNKLSITLNLSPVAFSLQFMKWSQVNAAETWNTLGATLEWIDATIVA